jgi:predicted chitinase
VNIGPDFEADPDMLEMPTWAAITSAWAFADEFKCNALADEHRFMSITTRICGSANPELNGMKSRLAWNDKVRAALAAG